MTRATRKLFLNAAAATALTISGLTHAHAVVLKSANQSLLCKPNAEDGLDYVEARDLYALILAEAKISNVLISDAGAGMRDLVLDPNFPPNSSRPGAEAKLEEMRNAKNGIVNAVIGDLSAFAAAQQGYLMQTASDLPEKFKFIGFFKNEPPFAIKCEEVSTPGSRAKEINKSIISALGGLRIRKDIDELTLITEEPTDETVKEREKGLKSAKLATFSVAQNYETDETTIGIEGAIGYRIQNFTPFVAYETIEKSGDDNDIEVVSPGILYDKLFLKAIGPAAIHVRGKAFTALDLEQEAQRLAFEGSLEPGFSIAPGFALGGYSAPFDGPVWIRPSVQLIGEASHVVDAGSSVELAEADNFFGVGTKAGLKVKLPELPILNTATLSFDYRVLQMIAGDDALYDQFEVSLDWTPEDLPYLGVSVSYEIGENQQTYQDEESLTFSLGVRF